MPEALRTAQKSIKDTAAEWQETTKNIDDRRLNDDDLGLLGKAADVVGNYNKVLDHLRKYTTEGAKRLQSMSKSLDEVATTYENQDAAYYRKFGWIKDGLDKPYQPHNGS